MSPGHGARLSVRLHGPTTHKATCISTASPTSPLGLADGHCSTSIPLRLQVSRSELSVADITEQSRFAHGPPNATAHRQASKVKQWQRNADGPELFHFVHGYTRELLQKCFCVRISRHRRLSPQAPSLGNRVHLLRDFRIVLGRSTERRIVGCGGGTGRGLILWLAPTRDKVQCA